MKLCFSTLGCTERSFDDILLLAKKYDIHALEIRGISGCIDNGKIPEFFVENTEKTTKKFSDANVVPLVLGTSCSFHDESKYDNAIVEGKEAIDIAQRIGFRAVRVFGDIINGNEREIVERVARGVKELCEYALDKGVCVYLEVHSDFNTVATLSPVVENCKSLESFALIWDICHTRETYPEWRDFYSVFAPYIKHVHVKDILGSEHKIPGEGNLPIRDVVFTLREMGYDGYFSLEWERKWHPELPEIEIALDGLLKLLSEN